MSIARSMRAQSRTLPNNPRKAVHTVREHDAFQVCKSLSQEDYADLEQIHRELTSGAGKGAAQWVFARKRDGTLAAGNFVGIITTTRGRAVEILPKIDLGDQPEQDYETTRSCFLKMLRWHRGLAKAAHLPDSSIRGLRRFPMLEVFVLQFLKALERAGSWRSRPTLPAGGGKPAAFAWANPFPRTSSGKSGESGAVLCLA